MIADRLRAAILQAAISGKLTDQHPEDGTATELLEQIAAERAALVKAGKLKKRSKSVSYQWRALRTGIRGEFTRKDANGLK